MSRYEVRESYSGSGCKSYEVYDIAEQEEICDCALEYNARYICDALNIIDDMD